MGQPGMWIAKVDGRCLDVLGNGSCFGGAREGDMLQRSQIKSPRMENHPESLAALGIASARQGDPLTALRLLRRSIEGDRDCYLAWLGLFETFRAIDEPRRAARSLRIARLLRSRGPQSSHDGGRFGSATA